MKKLMLVVLALMMMLSGIASAFAEEDEFADTPMPEAAEAFAGTWACDRASIDVDWDVEGFKVTIVWGSSVSETSEWEYSCYYNEEDNTLVSMPVGVHADYVYGEDGLFTSRKEYYDDGEATFSLDEEGHLIWKDEKEDAGQGMLFEKIGDAATEEEAAEKNAVKNQTYGKAAAAEAGEKAAVQPTVVSWETITSTPGIEQILDQGQVYTLTRYGLDVWIPNNMKSVETEQYVCHFTTEDENLYFIVKEEELPENVTNLDELAEYLKDSASDGVVTPFVINGINCFALTIRDGSTGAFVIPAGNIVLGVFVPNQLEDRTLETLKSITIASLKETSAE